jgi:hypothetical protein
MIDAALIAKVLDGRATPEERARVLAEADQSPEVLALLSDSAAAMPSGDQPQVIPIRRPRVTRGLMAGIAAVLIAAVTLPRFLGHPNLGPPIAFDMPTTSNAVALARGGAPVAAVRGGPDADRQRLSTFVGARLVDYITLGTDSARVTAAAEIADALKTIPGGAFVAARFDNVEPATREMIDDLERVVDVHAFRAGGAAELLRLSAQGGDEGVLRGGNVKQSFEYLAEDPRLADDARAVAQRIQAGLASGMGSSELANLAADLLGAMGSRR